MTDPGEVARRIPARVTVTSPRVGRRRRTTIASEIDAQSAVGEIYMRSLMKTQLRLALSVVGLLAATVGVLPLVFHLSAGVRRAQVLGLPLPWVVLGVVRLSRAAGTRRLLRAPCRADRGGLRRHGRPPGPGQAGQTGGAGIRVSTLAVLAVLAVSLVTLAVGVVGFRISRTTSDFYVASRAVGPFLNASAISGEYLSAASFLGVAGLVLLRGVDMLWYPSAGPPATCCCSSSSPRRCAGRGPTRCRTSRSSGSSRCGARRVASALVVLIGLLYLVPQFQGAGLTLRALTGSATWVGAVVVAVVVLANVVSGGMRSITIAQAFQYWLKLVALLTPLVFLLAPVAHPGAVRTHLTAGPGWSRCRARTRPISSTR